MRNQKEFKRWLQQEKRKAKKVWLSPNRDEDREPRLEVLATDYKVKIFVYGVFLGIVIALLLIYSFNAMDEIQRGIDQREEVIKSMQIAQDEFATAQCEYNLQSYHSNLLTKEQYKLLDGLLQCSGRWR